MEIKFVENSHKSLQHTQFIENTNTNQFAGAVEYTNCFSVEG